MPHQWVVEGQPDPVGLGDEEMAEPLQEASGAVHGGHRQRKRQGPADGLAGERLELFLQVAPAPRPSSDSRSKRPSPRWSAG